MWATRNSQISLLGMALLILAIMSCRKTAESVESAMAAIERATLVDSAVAGQEITMRFRLNRGKPPVMLVSNALGTTLVTHELADNTLNYTWPDLYSQKAGISHWSLISEGTEVLTGKIIIAPGSQPARRLEAYIGPRSLIAGTGEYNMIIALPSDQYDNPSAKGTPVVFKRQFGRDVRQENSLSNDLIAWIPVYPPNKTGRVLLGASSQGIASKEFSMEIYPAKAADFTISAKRNHSYADGNQVVSIETSEIRDTLGNLVSDGTYILYLLEDENGVKSQASATTINGVATARISHPQKPLTWKVHALAVGAARSNSIELKFEAAFEDYPIQVSDNGRKITAGPIQSFMGQDIPDGFIVTFELIDEQGHMIHREEKETRNGKSAIVLDPFEIPSGTYMLKISSGGIEKKSQLILSDGISQ